MNSLASILYSSSSAKKTKKRKNLSLQPSVKPLTNMFSKNSKCKGSGMLLRSSTPKTLLTTAAHPISNSSYASINSSESPRCSTPLYSRQRRTRPFIACELCRQRAFDSIDENRIEKQSPLPPPPPPPQQQISHLRSATSCQYQNQISTKNSRRPPTLEQLLVWIV